MFDESTSSVLERGNDSSIGNRVQLLRTGTFRKFDPDTGQVSEIQITPTMLSNMVTNFKNEIRGIDIAIDYRHDNHDIAAGWIQEVQLSDDQEILFATKIKWTPKALQTLSDKEFRYISAEFHPNYSDNETGKNFGATLLGAGLTNRPVVKRMEPIVQLSEKTTGGYSMPTEAVELLKQQNKDLQDKVSKLSEENKKLEDEQEKLQEMDMSPEEMLAKIKELEAKIAEMEKEKESMAQEKEMAEKESKFTHLLSEGRAVPAQKEAYLSGDMEKFIELSEQLNTSASGHGVQSGRPDGSAEDKIMELAQKKVKEDKVELADAISTVLSENGKLAEAYYKAVEV